MTIVIAEAGSNHNGSLERAIELVHVAKRAGADYCKFQFINPDGLYLPVVWAKDGQDFIDSDVYKLRCKEVLSDDKWRNVWDVCKGIDMGVTASVFDIEGIRLLQGLGADMVKIASCDLNNRELHDLACDSFDWVIISTGMATVDEVIEADQYLRKRHPRVRVDFLFCTSLYPTLLKQVDFHRLATLQRLLGKERVGYSDHTLDNIAASVARSMGVEIFEKHFTISKSLPGFDHIAALEEPELLEYVNTLKSLRFGKSEITETTDSLTAIRARRGLYAARTMYPGEVLQRSDILCVRPTSTLSPNDMPLIIGKSVAKLVKQYEPLSLDCDSVCTGESRSSEANEYWSTEMEQKGIKG